MSCFLPVALCFFCAALGSPCAWRRLLVVPLPLHALSLLLVSLFSSCFSLSLSADKRMERNAALSQGVTDGSLQALAEAGCGKNLTSLTLWGECLFLLLSLAFFRVLFFLLCRVWLYPLSDVASLLSSFPCTRSLPLHALSPFPVSLFFPSLLTRG